MGASCCQPAAEEDFPELSSLPAVSVNESSSKSLLRGGSASLVASALQKSGKVGCDVSQDGVDGVARRPKSFNAAAVPASPTLSKRSAVPLVSEGSNVGSLSLSSRNNSIGVSLVSSVSSTASGEFGSMDLGGSPKRNMRGITWCEVTEVAVFRV